MRNLRSLSIIIALLALIGCDSNLDSNVEQLVSAKNRWEQSGYGRSYSYIFNKHCSKQIQQPKILVTEGQAYALNEQGNIKNKLPDGTLFTIKGLMNHILELIKENETGKLKFEVKYDAKLGYPTYLKVNPKFGGIDSRYEICISNLKINGA